MTDIKYMPGDYMKLGVTRQGNNTNFAVAIGDTDEVFLKLFKVSYIAPITIKTPNQRTACICGK